jgi:hypothetical protein
VNNSREESGINEEFIATVLKRWRSASTSQYASLDDGSRDARVLEQNTALPLQPVQAVEPTRPEVLKQPTPDRLDVTRAFRAPAKPYRQQET